MCVERYKYQERSVYKYIRLWHLCSTVCTYSMMFKYSPWNWAEAADLAIRPRHSLHPHVVTSGRCQNTNATVDVTIFYLQFVVITRGLVCSL